MLGHGIAVWTNSDGHDHNCCVIKRIGDLVARD
jgi:hypothetical protein